MKQLRIKFKLIRVRPSMLSIFLTLASGISFSQSGLAAGESFGEMALSTQPNFINRAIGTECTENLRVVLSKGAKFNTQRMMDNHIMSIEEFPDPTVQDGTFYHYTSRLESLAFAKQSDPVGLIKDKRSLNSPNPYLYIAGDTVSSAWVGYKTGNPPNFQLIVKLVPRTLIFLPHGLDESPTLPGPLDRNKTFSDENTKLKMGETNKKLNAIENEIIIKYPSLEVCRGKMGNYSQDFKLFSREPILPILVNIAAEHANAGVILYKSSLERRTTYAWLQVINARSIESLSAGSFSQQQQNEAQKYAYEDMYPSEDILWRVQLKDFVKTNFHSKPSVPTAVH